MSRPKDTKRQDPETGDFVETGEGETGYVGEVFHAKNSGGITVRYGMVNGRRYATALLSVVPSPEEMKQHRIRLKREHLEGMRMQG